jgi:hypothetical protein
MPEQLMAPARVLGGDDGDVAQGSEGAEGDVLEIADGGRHDVQRPRGHRLGEVSTRLGALTVSDVGPASAADGRSGEASPSLA